MLALTLALACGDKDPTTDSAPPAEDTDTAGEDTGPDTGSSEGGSYAHFEGTSAVFSTNMYVAFPQNTAGTVEFRLRNLGLETQWAAVVHHDWPEGGASYSRLIVEDDDTVLLQAYSEEHDVINARMPLQPRDTWVHYAWVNDPEAAEVILYVDGVEVSRQDRPESFTVLSGNPTYTLGGPAPFGLDANFDVDDLRHWGVARTAEQIVDAADRPLTDEEMADILVVHDFEDGFTPTVGTNVSLQVELLEADAEIVPY